MQLEPTALPEVLLLTPRVFSDARGYFFESWNAEQAAAAGLTASFVQDNHSHSLQYTLRGLHYQLRHPQGKLVRVSRGAAFDVAVDIRRSSARFGQWVGVTLSEANHRMLWIPPGFAHGYLALAEQVDFLYKCTSFYDPQDERSIRWDDAHLGIHWPLPAGTAPRLSPKDAGAPLFEAAEHYP